MSFSTVPLLVVAILLFFPVCVLAIRRRRIGNSPRFAPLLPMLIVLSIWIAFSTWASCSGFYHRPEFLEWLPGFWLPFIPMVITLTFYQSSSALRDTLKEICEQTPSHWHVMFQGLRVVAAGAMFKAWHGEFPTYFAVYSGGPDLLFAVSAFWMAGTLKRRPVGRRSLAAWHAMGFAALGLTAPWLLQLGLTGPLQVFTDTPTGDVILEFPMALAPTFTGPMFMMMNALWIKHLLCDCHVNTIQGCCEDSTAPNQGGCFR